MFLFLVDDLLVAFGVGLTWASGLMRWYNPRHSPLETRDLQWNIPSHTGFLLLINTVPVKETVPHGVPLWLMAPSPEFAGRNNNHQPTKAFTSNRCEHSSRARLRFLAWIARKLNPS